jgi:hypothetical protein
VKAELRPAPHLVDGDRTVIEVWYDGVFLATVVAADGPGVKIISKHQLVATLDVPPTRGTQTHRISIEGHTPNVIAVQVGSPR